MFGTDDAIYEEATFFCITSSMKLREVTWCGKL